MATGGSAGLIAAEEHPSRWVRKKCGAIFDFQFLVYYCSFKIAVFVTTFQQKFPTMQLNHIYNVLPVINVINSPRIIRCRMYHNPGFKAILSWIAVLDML